MKKLILLAAALVAGCGQKETPQATDTIVYARGADSKKLDPADIEDGESVNVVTQIFDTLVAFEPGSTRIEPALATEWSTSSDGRTWTFKLRAGVRFHDGAPFDAAAVVSHFNRLVRDNDPNRHGISSPYGFMYQMIEKVEAKNGDAVFTLTKPNGTFLTNLAMFPASISSPAAVEFWKKDYGQHPVGTGPFKFVSWTPEQKIVLEANSEYWGGAPKTKKVVFAVIKENSVRLERLKAGEVHIMDGLGLSDMGGVSADPKLKLLVKPGMNFCYLAINNQRPPFDRPEVRQAIARAIDKNELLKLGYSGVGQTGPNPLPPTIWGYNESIADYAYEPAEAKKVLEASGLAGKEIDFFVMTNPRGYIPDPANVGSVVRQRLEAAGLKVRIQSPAWQQYLLDLKQGKHDIAVIGWMTDNGDPDNFLYTLLHSSGIGDQNHAFYKSAEYDRLVEQAQEATDIGKRTELYRKAQEVLRRDTPVVPLAYLPQMAATRANVQGYDLHPMGLVRLKDARLGP